MHLAILRDIFQLFRIENTIHPIIAIIAGFVLASHTDYSALIVVIVSYILLHSLVTFWNDISDEAIDEANGQSTMHALRLRLGMRGIVSICMVLFGLWMITLFFLPSVITVLLMLGILLVSWAYNMKPLQLSHRPILAQVCLFLGYGFIPVLLGAVPFFGLSIWLFAFGWGLARSSLSLLKDFKDARGDAMHDKKTPLLVYGKTIISRASVVLASVGMGMVITALYVSYRSWSIGILIAIATVLVIYRLQLFRLHQYSQLNNLFHKALLYQLIFDGGVVVWLTTLLPSS